MGPLLIKPAGMMLFYTGADTLQAPPRKKTRGGKCKGCLGNSCKVCLDTQHPCVRPSLLSQKYGYIVFQSWPRSSQP